MLDDLRDLTKLDPGEVPWTRGIADKNNLQEAVNRINKYFNFPDKRRARISQSGTIELPNYQLNRKYKQGGLVKYQKGETISTKLKDWWYDYAVNQFIFALFITYI